MIVAGTNLYSRVHVQVLLFVRMYRRSSAKKNPRSKEREREMGGLQVVRINKGSTDLEPAGWSLSVTLVLTYTGLVKSLAEAVSAAYTAIWAKCFLYVKLTRSWCLSVTWSQRGQDVADSSTLGFGHRDYSRRGVWKFISCSQILVAWLVASGSVMSVLFNSWLCAIQIISICMD